MSAEWTTTPPSVAGHYEYRVREKVVGVRVESVCGVMPVAFSDEGGFNRVDLLTAFNPGGEWRGPLAEEGTGCDVSGGKS